MLHDQYTYGKRVTGVSNNNNDFQYLLYKNFVPVTEGRVQSRLNRTQALNAGYRLEGRFNIMCDINNNDFTTYLNYYTLIVMSISVIHEESTKYAGSRFIAMLGAGYVPVFAPPTIGNFDYLEEIFIKYLEDNNIRYYTERQHSIISPRSAESRKRDIWASRIDICNKTGVDIEKFDIFKFMTQEVLA